MDEPLAFRIGLGRKSRPAVDSSDHQSGTCFQICRSRAVRLGFGHLADGYGIGEIADVIGFGVGDLDLRRLEVLQAARLPY